MVLINFVGVVDLIGSTDLVVVDFIVSIAFGGVVDLIG